ncbi:MAG TPA: alpha/beta hydrolase [Bryobacteraceae bacterium]|nr:alpha/beta hydrolase [Bryobacteraceae bacterium]
MSISRWAVALCVSLSMTTIVFAAEVHRDIEYSRAADISLRLDASIPDGSGPFPAVIIVHGGGWVRGDKRIDVAPLFEPLSAAGIAWFSIDYRLASDPFQFGAAIEDVEAAIRFVRKQAAEYRIDPDRIALIGESAGGQLAAMAALNGSVVKAVVAIYTPTDLVSLLKTSDLIPPQIRHSLTGTPLEGLLLTRLAQLSPIEKVRPGMPPFLMIHGTADPLVPFEQSKAMCAKMQAVGASCDLFRVPGGGHGIRGWEFNPAIAEPYKVEMIRWLSRQLAATGIVVL